MEEAKVTSSGTTKTGDGGVLVCVDGSRMSDKAFDQAAYFAHNRRLVALHVSDKTKTNLPKHFNPDFLMFQLERKLVNKSYKDYELRIEPRSGRKIPSVIHGIIAEEKPELLVMGQFGRKGASVWGTGSNTDWSVRDTSVDTAIVNSKSTPLTDKGNMFLACVDGSPAMTKKVVQTATSIMNQSTDKLVIFHVRKAEGIGARNNQFAQASAAVKAATKDMEFPDQSSRLDMEATLALEQLLVANGADKKVLADVAHEFLIKEDNTRKTVAQTLVSVAEELEADVILLGVDGMSAHLNNKPSFGSTSDAVAKTARSTVVIVKRPGWRASNKW